MATIGYKIGRFQFQGGTKADWEAAELILLENEIALERDTETNSIKMRVGDGKSKYADCPYIDIGTISVESLSEEDKAKMRGPKGEPGKDFTYDMFTSEQRLDLKGDPGDKGNPGKDGKSIKVVSSTVDSDKSVNIKFSDGVIVNIPPGKKAIRVILVRMGLMPLLQLVLVLENLAQLYLLILAMSLLSRI